MGRLVGDRVLVGAGGMVAVAGGAVGNGVLVWVAVGGLVGNGVIVGTGETVAVAGGTVGLGVRVRIVGERVATRVVGTGVVVVYPPGTNS